MSLKFSKWNFFPWDDEKLFQFCVDVSKVYQTNAETIIIFFIMDYMISNRVFESHIHLKMNIYTDVENAKINIEEANLFSTGELVVCFVFFTMLMYLK